VAEGILMTFKSEQSCACLNLTRRYSHRKTYKYRRSTAIYTEKACAEGGRFCMLVF